MLAMHPLVWLGDVPPTHSGVPLPLSGEQTRVTSKQSSDHQVLCMRSKALQYLRPTAECTYVCVYVVQCSVSTLCASCNLRCLMSPLMQLTQVLHLGLSTEAAREPHSIQHPSGQRHTPCIRHPTPSVPNQEQKAAESHAEVRREGVQ